MEDLGYLDNIFRSQYDFLCSKNNFNRESITKDKYTNNKIIESIVKGFEEYEKEMVKEYLSLIKRKVSDIGKELIFEFSYSSIKAETVNLNKRIEIRISTIVNLNELQKIFLHELGETEYIVNKYPVIIDSKKRNDIQWRIIEIFTHRFIYNRLQELGFIKYTTVFSKFWLENDYLEYDDIWESVLMIAWALTTYPKLMDSKMLLTGYEKYHNYIDSIIFQLNDKKLFESQNFIFEACKKVKCIFEELGAKDFAVTTLLNNEID